MMSVGLNMQWEFLGVMKFSEKTCTIFTPATTNPTYTDMGSNLDRQGLEIGK
jgi:hypothetical protein